MPILNVCNEMIHGEIGPNMARNRNYRSFFDFDIKKNSTKHQHFAVVPRSCRLPVEGLQRLGLWSIWGHTDVFCCPVCSSDWHQRHCCAKTTVRPRRVAWPRQRRSDASARGKFLFRSAVGGGFLSRPPDDAAAAQRCLTRFDHPHTSRPSSRLRLWRLHRVTASCGNREAEEFPSTAAANRVAEAKPQEVVLLKTFWGVWANRLGVSLILLICSSSKMMNHSSPNVFSSKFCRTGESLSSQLTENN